MQTVLVIGQTNCGYHCVPFHNATINSEHNSFTSIINLSLLGRKFVGVLPKCAFAYIID